MAQQRYLRARRQRRYRLLLCWFGGLGVAIILSFVAHALLAEQAATSTQMATPTPSPLARLVPGMSAPDFTLPIVRGGSYHLAAWQGHPMVLTFLATQPDDASTPSRSQAVVLLSIEHQYGPKGVEVVLIDASELTEQSPVPDSQLLNVTYDWGLNTLPLLAEPLGDTTARTYGIQQLPTTFLIDSHEHIVQRWDGLALSAQIGLALQQQVGAPTL